MYTDLRNVAYDGSLPDEDNEDLYGMTMRQLDGDSNYTETMQIGPYNPEKMGAVTLFSRD